MARKGKRLRAAEAKVEREKAYPLADAVALIKQTASAKFDETIEVALNLGVDPRHADQMVRGTVDLPHGTGKSVRVAVFARGERAEEAKAAGYPVADIFPLSQKLNTQPGMVSDDELHPSGLQYARWVDEEIARVAEKALRAEERGGSGQR